MSTWENGLYNYIEGRLAPLERTGVCYFFRNNSFSGRISRYDGSTGFIKNSKRGTPDVVACFRSTKIHSGLFVGFELKTLTGKQSPDQKQAQLAIESAGGMYFLIRTPEEFEKVLEILL